MSRRRIRLPTRSETRAEWARRRLLDFTTHTKPDYQVNWHHRLLCDYLDRFARREIRRLMVFLPPRHGKSELVSRRLPAYLLGRNPNAQVIACSYSSDLSSRLNRDVQRVIDSAAYREVFPGTRLGGSNVRTVAQGSVLRNSDIFEIVGAKGAYRSAGVGGGITGMGFDFGIIDDPIKNAEQANSRTYREAVYEWYTSTFYTRQSSEGSTLLTVTRWHDDDLAGRLLRLAREDAQADQWTIVRLPAIAEPGGMPEDTRRDGEPLWPALYGEDFLRRTRVSVGPYNWAALYQQRPAPLGGAVFQSAWFRRFAWAGHDIRLPASFVLRKDCEIFGIMDPAGGAKGQGDYTAIGIFALTPGGNLLVLDMVRERIALEHIVSRLAQICKEWRPKWVGSESTGLYSVLAREARRRPDMPPVRELHPGSKSKFVRATPAVVRAESGQIYLPAGAEWVATFLDEVTRFTGNEDRHDDQVDVLAYAAAHQTGQLQRSGQAFSPYVIPRG